MCKVEFNSNQVTIKELMSYLFEMIDPYSLNKQGQDVGEKISITGIYSDDSNHLNEAPILLIVDQTHSELWWKLNHY